MRTSLKTLVGGTALAVIAGGMLGLGAGAASAAAPPSYQPDPNALGTVSFYDASGAPKTSGNLTDAPFATYYKASNTNAPAGTLKAAVVFYTPVKGQTPAAWQTANNQTSSQTFPNGTYPAPLNTGIVIKDDSGATLADQIAVFPSADTDDPNVYQVRIFVTPSLKYWSADVLINPTAGTWTQIYPPVTAGPTQTTTTLTAAPDPSTVGDTVTLTATEAPAAPGSIQFKVGATSLGAAVAVDGTGKATATTNALPQGANNLSAVFTPTDTTAFTGSTGTATATVNAANNAVTTTTALAISGNNTQAGQAATLTATVTPTAAAGTVAFFDNASATPLVGTVTNTTPGTYVLDLPSGFAAGPHSVVAKFTPTDPTAYKASQSAPQSFVTQGQQSGACSQTGSVCTDTQNIQATIPVGTLVINTPYTPANPLDLGTLALSPDSKTFSGSKPFQNIVVTDTRSGALPWTVSALSSPLTDGGANPNSTINAQNVGLTAVTSTPGTGFTGTVVTTDNPAAPGVAPADPGSLGLGGATPHTVATATVGLGTDTLQGTLTLNAPSSTEAGLFTGTITFTVG